MGAACRVIHADAHRYVAHPHMVALPGGDFLMVANRGPRRAVTLHPPHDPEFSNILLRSSDEGETWSDPAPVPGFGVTGTECAGLTVLQDGAVLLNQFRFRWHPDSALPDGETMLTSSAELRRERFGSTELDPAAGVVIDWARGGNVATALRSTDAMRFGPAVEIDVAPYCGGYGMRGAAVLGDGTVLLPLSDAPDYRRIFAVRSKDGGRTWSAPETIADVPGHDFEEPAPIVLPDGTILLLLRDNFLHILHAVRSRDDEATWSAPEPTGIPGYPAHLLLLLPDGRLAAIVGERTPPLRIAAYLSGDAGRTWDTDNPVTVAALPHRDLGYPTAALCADGSVFVAWYHRDAAGVTGLHCKRLRI